MARTRQLDPWSPATLKEEKFWPMDLFTRSIVLYVAVKLNTFECLVKRPLAAEDVAEQLRTNTKGTRILLDALVALRYLKKSNGRYLNALDTVRYLTKSSPEYIGTMLLHSYKGISRWFRLEALVRHGQKYKHKLPEFQRNESQERKRAREFAFALNQSSRETAELLAKTLDLKRVTEMLDLGGGAGTYSIALAKRWPSLRPVIFELPVPAKVAKEQAKKAGLPGRVSVKVGDFLKDDLGKEAYDVAFMSNIIHNFGPSDNQRIIRKVYRALRPGGRIFVKDMILNEGRTGPYYPLIFALTMLMFTDEGDTYTQSQVTGWLKDAGFTRISSKVVIPHETSIVTGYKTSYI